ncbi:carboxymuconolactone decarboxylase family protein [bacterium]|nr:carboxymuconolactone decarboxylase family protein [bacterium]
MPKKASPKKLPAHFTQFVKTYPDVAKAYNLLSKASKEAGPLNVKTTALVKLGIAIGLKHEGAVHSHVRKSLEAGAKPDEIRHVAILALTTVGFPSMMAALSWVNDILENK